MDTPTQRGTIAAEWRDALNGAGIRGLALVGGAVRDQLLGIPVEHDLDVQAVAQPGPTLRLGLRLVRRLASQRASGGQILYSMVMREIAKRLTRRHPVWGALRASGLLDGAHALLNGGASFRGVAVHVVHRLVLTTERHLLTVKRAPSFELVWQDGDGAVAYYDERCAEDFRRVRVRLTGGGVLSVRAVLTAVALKHQYVSARYDPESWAEMQDFVRRLDRRNLIGHYNLRSHHAQHVNLHQLGGMLQRAGLCWDAAVDDLQTLGLLPLLVRANPMAEGLLAYRRRLGTQPEAADRAREAEYERLLRAYPRKRFPLDRSPVVVGGAANAAPPAVTPPRA